MPGCRSTVETPMDYMSKNMPSTSMTRVACESKLRSVVTSSMHPWPGNCWQSGLRSRIMPGMSTHLVRDLDVGSVYSLLTVVHTTIISVLQKYNKNNICDTIILDNTTYGNHVS